MLERRAYTTPGDVAVEDMSRTEAPSPTTSAVRVPWPSASNSPEPQRHSYDTLGMRRNVRSESHTAGNSDRKSPAAESAERLASVEQVRHVESMAEVLMDKHAALVDDYEDLAVRNEELEQLLVDMEAANRTMQHDRSAMEQQLRGAEELCAYLKAEVERSKTAASAAATSLSDEAYQLREELHATRKAWDADRAGLLESFSQQMRRREDLMQQKSTQTDLLRSYDKATATSARIHTVSSGTNTNIAVPMHESTQTAERSLSPVHAAPLPQPVVPPQPAALPSVPEDEPSPVRHHHHHHHPPPLQGDPQGHQHHHIPRHHPRDRTSSRHTRRGHHTRGSAVMWHHPREGEASMEVSPATSQASSPMAVPLDAVQLGRMSPPWRPPRQASTPPEGVLQLQQALPHDGQSPQRIERFDPTKHLEFSGFENMLAEMPHSRSPRGTTSEGRTGHHHHHPRHATPEPTPPSAPRGSGGHSPPSPAPAVWTTEALITFAMSGQPDAPESADALEPPASTPPSEGTGGGGEGHHPPRPVLALEAPAEETVSRLVTGNTSPRRAPHLGRVSPPPSRGVEDGVGHPPSEGLHERRCVSEEVVPPPASDGSADALQEHPGARLAWPVGALCRTAAGSLGRIKARAPNGFIIESDVSNDIFLPYAEVRVLRDAVPQARGGGGGGGAERSLPRGTTRSHPRSPSAGGGRAVGYDLGDVAPPPGPVASLASPPASESGSFSPERDPTLSLSIPQQWPGGGGGDALSQASNSGVDLSQYPRTLHPAHYQQTAKRVSMPYTPKKYSLLRLAGC